MIPDRSKVPNSKISATAKGYQTGSTLLETLKIWDRQLTERGVPKPVVWTTDGHSSRLNRDVLGWCRENEWIMFISPPHTTGIHQALDQIFKSWHDTFNAIVKRWAEEHTGKELNKQIFTDIFAEAWQNWTTPDKVVAAFRRVGVSIVGLNPDAVPKEKFVLASTVAKPPPALPAPADATATTAMVTPLVHDAGTGLPLAGMAGPSGATPAGQAGPSSATPQPAPRTMDFSGEYESPEPGEQFERNSLAYWKEKARLSSARARELFSEAKTLHETPLTLKATHPAWQVRKASPPREDGARGKQRLRCWRTWRHGRRADVGEDG
jgi:hypothetical protein